MKENDEKFLEMIKEQAKNDTVTDHGLYEMLQEYMIENETLRYELLQYSSTWAKKKKHIPCLVYTYMYNKDQKLSI